MLTTLSICLYVSATQTISPSVQVVLLTILLLTGFVQLDYQRQLAALHLIHLDLSLNQSFIQKGGQSNLLITIKNLSAHDFIGLKMMIIGADGIVGIKKIDLPQYSQITLHHIIYGIKVGNRPIWGGEVSTTGRWNLIKVHQVKSVYLPVHVYPRLDMLRQLPERQRAQIDKFLADQQAKNGGADHGVMHELRAYQRGDRRSQIAWHATARHGELMSIEYQRPASRVVYIALDVSPIMHRRLVHQRRIDIGIDLVMSLAKLMKGDQLNICLFDHTVLANLAVQTESLYELQRLLMYAAQMIHRNCTDATQLELIDWAKSYLKWSSNEPTPYIPEDMLTVVQKTAKSLENIMPPKVFQGHIDDNEYGRILRILCWRLGVSIPYRSARPEKEQMIGMVDLVKLMERARPTELHIISHTQRLSQRALELSRLHQYLSQGASCTWYQVGSTALEKSSFLQSFRDRLNVICIPEDLKWMEEINDTMGHSDV